MGLDLSIREQLNVHENEKSQLTWQVVEIGNYRNVWELLENLEIKNCATECFYGKEIKDYIKNLESENEKQTLEELFKLLDDEKSYEVHAWW